jgi:hypothetical protein
MGQAAVVFVLFLLWSSLAHAEKRVALVIGNGAYQKVSRLPNPTNDAKAIAGMLRAAGFDEVTLYENLVFRELRQAIKEFSNLARDADTAVVYYSGHGIEANGINYLIPTDAVLDSDIDVPYEAYSLDNLVQVLEPARRLRLVILDACRDNPFARSMKRTIASRAVGGGLAPIEPASVNTLIGFAAKAGSIALDGQGANSPYTTALLNHIAAPGLDLRIAFGRVRDEVLKVTRNKQEPFVYGSLGGTEISLVSGTAPQQNATPPQLIAPAMPLRPVVDYDKEIEITFWNAVKDGRSKDLLQTYLDRYPSGNFAVLARVLIEQIEKEQTATRRAAERDTQAQLAEAARIAAEAKQAEELRKADALRREEEKKRTDAVQRAQAEARAEAQRAQEATRKAEADRLAALKAAEEARREADAARAEQQRLAKLAADAEAAKKATTVVAALPPGEQGTAAAKPVDDAIADQAKLARALQTELKRVGCDPGNVDGVWGGKAKGALAEFARVAKVTLPSDAPSPEALQLLLVQKGRICPLVCGEGQHERDGSCTGDGGPKGNEISRQAKRREPEAQKSKTPRAKCGYATEWAQKGQKPNWWGMSRAYSCD